MGHAGEQPPEVPSPQPAGESVHLEAHASDQARINQAARDLHVHYGEGVRRAEPGTATAECPYPGLASFGPEQARWFFGREQLTAELITRLDVRLRTGGVQAVVAPSGAGKSSLLHAGLLPKLDNGALPGSNRWQTVVFTPTAQPLAALATQIAALTGADPVALAEQLAADSRQPLGGICGVDSGTRLVLVVDQFEELFTLCNDDRQRHTFVELLTRIATARSDTGPDPQPVGLVVIGVRADFCAACVDYPHLRTALQDSPLVVGPMSNAELRAAILYPAQEMGLDVEPGLIELLLRDLGDTTAAAGQDGRAGYAAGRLPLLAHALRATWQQRHDHLLTVEGYRATGGIHQAVATTADRVFAGLDSAGQDLARILFLRLIRIGDGTEDTRRRMARPDLLPGLDPGSALPVLDAFTQGRLLTQDRDTVEITHEALLRAWPRLRQWIDTDRTGNLTRQELEDTAAAWERDGRDNAGLYRGSRLEVARAWTASRSHEGDLSPAASAFLAVSTQQEHRAAKIRRSVLVVLTVLALIASSAAVVAFRENSSAQEKRDTAIVNRIVSEADRLRSTDASLAAQLDLTAYREGPQTPELYTKLLTTENTVLSTPLPPGHTDAVRSVKFSPDGRTLATVGDDDTIRLWDVADPTRPVKLGEPLPGHDGDIQSIAFSPDGRTLATAGDDETVRLWNVTDPARPAPLGVPLTGHTGTIFSVAFSPNGRTVASAGDETVRLWDLTDPAHPTPLGQPLFGHTGTASSVAFSPDQRTLASASTDQTIRLWNVTDLAHPAPWGEPLTGHPDTILSLAFSPNGHTLASAGAGGSGDYRIRLWDVTDPTRPASQGLPLGGHTNNVFSVAFSPDGQTLVSASADRTVRLWNHANPAATVTLSTPLTGHTGPVTSVVFSPDGHTVASASTDHVVRLWDIPKTVLTGHTFAVFSAAFSPDGKTLASASADKGVRLWDVTNPTQPSSLDQPLIGHIGVASVAFSPNGRTLATASAANNADNFVRLWDVTDPTQPKSLGQPLTEHNGKVLSVAFSPDGRTLATAGDDDTVRLWDVTDPAHPALLGQPLTEHSANVLSVRFSPDGRILASAGEDETILLWNVIDPAHPALLGQPLIGHTDDVFSVVFSPDRRILASVGNDQVVRLWDVMDPAQPRLLGEPLGGHRNSVNAVAFSPDGHTLASASVDRTVRLWDVIDPAHPTPRGEPLTGHTISATSVAFSPDGHTLATGSLDFTVRLWGMNLDHAIQRICDTTISTLTEEKWRQHVSEDLPFKPPCPR